MKVQIDANSCQGHGRCYDLASCLFGEDDEGFDDPFVGHELLRSCGEFIHSE